MNSLKKTLSLVKSELKSNTGGEAVVVLMLTVMIVCANIMINAISVYAQSLIYMMNPNAGNAVIIRIWDDSADFDDIRAYPEVEFGIEACIYNASPSPIYAVSDDLLSEELSFLSKSNIDALKNAPDSDRVPMLASRSSRLDIGQKGTLSEGLRYEIVGIVNHDEIAHIIGGRIAEAKFVIAIDKGQFTALTPVTDPCMFAGLSKSADKAEFKEKYGSLSLSIADFDPFDVISREFSDSITLSIIGVITFTISLFGVIINCYLVFGSKRKYYRALMTVGGKKRTFLRSGAVIKAAQLLFSIAFSLLAMLAVNEIFGGSNFSLLSILISSVLAILIIGISCILLNRWLGKLSCTES